MSIRLPFQGVVSRTFANETGTSSTALGGIPFTFTIPQDTDNVVVKFQASMVGGAVSATFQTTDDGGTTWFDVQRTSVVTNAIGSTSEWLTISTLAPGQRSNLLVGSTVAAGSVVANGAFGQTIGNAAASSLGSREISGLPLLSQFGRVFIRITGNVTAAASSTIITDVKVNSQTATA